MKPIVHQIPICPFCQRLEILLELKGKEDAVTFEVADITKPRDPKILELTGGSTALPVMDLGEGRGLKQSLVIMEYLEDLFDETPIRRTDPYERALENLLVTKAGRFIGCGYRLVMNQDLDKREELLEQYKEALGAIDAFLRKHSTGDGPWLFEDFGWAEAVFTPFFQRFAMNTYFENADVPAMEGFERVGQWRDASVAHPAAQQTSDEEVIKSYYDYALGAGNGELLPGRKRSSFSFTPHWKDRPMPPRDKYNHHATDEELGLV